MIYMRLRIDLFKGHLVCVASEVPQQLFSNGNYYAKQAMKAETKNTNSIWTLFDDIKASPEAFEVLKSMTRSKIGELHNTKMLGKQVRILSPKAHLSEDFDLEKVRVANKNQTHYTEEALNFMNRL